MVLSKTFTLTETQRRVLNRGLTYIPTLNTRKRMKEDFMGDLRKFHRRVKLAAYFEDQEEGEQERFVYPSTWSPRGDQLPPEVDMFINQNLRVMKKEFKTIPEKQNLTKEEFLALRDLRMNNNIIIKPADKGSMVVILDKINYIMEVERQLTDTEYYKKLEAPIYLDTIPMIRNIVLDMESRNYITKKQTEYLMGSAIPRERRFYILPKIHKDPKGWTIPYELPPGRPIVSDCESESYHTAEFLEFHLHPISIKHPAYIKDTNHFISIIKKLKIPKTSFFFTIDVKNLYTNIEIDKGVEVIKKYLEKYPEENRPDEHIIKLLKINLERNDFVFNRKYYLQIKGTAMGKRFAPSYANIFMANWEEKALGECPIQPRCFYRYLDDIFGIWEGSKDTFQEFIKILNDQDPSIQLTTEMGDEKIVYLDTIVYKGAQFWKNNQLDIKVYFKTTDKHALLHKSSWHPKHTFRGLIESQILRFKRICTQERDFEEAIQILFRALKPRGYNRAFLKDCLKRVKKREGTGVRKGEQAGGTKLIPFITKYSQTANWATLKIQKHLVTHLTNKGILSNYRMIKAYRRNQNLKDILTRARMPDSAKMSVDKFPQLCHRTSIQNTTDRTFYGIPQQFSLSSVNCVYLLTCGICNSKFVGETKGSLYGMLENYTKRVLYGKQGEETVIKHFRTHTWERAKLIGLQRDTDWTDQIRTQKVEQWVGQLDTRFPVGLNS